MAIYTNFITPSTSKTLFFGRRGIIVIFIICFLSCSSGITYKITFSPYSFGLNSIDEIIKELSEKYNPEKDFFVRDNIVYTPQIELVIDLNRVLTFMTAKESENRNSLIDIRIKDENNLATVLTLNPYVFFVKTKWNTDYIEVPDIGKYSHWVVNTNSLYMKQDIEKLFDEYCDAYGWITETEKNNFDLLYAFIKKGCSITYDSYSSSLMVAKIFELIRS